MINWKRPASGADIYVDLGSANTLIVTKAKGLVVNEPSVIAYEERGDGRRKVVAVGTQAKEKIGRAPQNLVACHPIREGVIADLSVTQTMLQHFLSRPEVRSRFGRPTVVISLPYGVSEIEKKAVREAGMLAGAKAVILMEEPIAAALGADLPIQTPRASMILDIGGGTTEVALISLYGIGHCESIRVGGHTFDAAIINYLKRNHNLIVGEPTAEKLKLQIGTALPAENERTAEVRGLDFVTGLPRALKVTSGEVGLAMKDSLQLIIDALHRTLENTPPELMSDLIDQGMVVAGGGALIQDLDKRLEREIKIPVRIALNPLEALARGGAKVLQDRDLLSRVLLERTSIIA
jgi:rod shape-determining protein MreB